MTTGTISGCFYKGILLGNLKCPPRDRAYVWSAVFWDFPFKARETYTWRPTSSLLRVFRCLSPMSYPSLYDLLGSVCFTMSQSTTVTSPTEPTRTAAPKPQRVLACVSCQQRKVKCDRKFPCANCFRSGAYCVPANSLAPRQRRRRFAERELLERLRNYEGLLRENDIDFEPLHPSTPASAAVADADHKSPTEDGRGPSGSLSKQTHSPLDEGVSRNKTAARPREAEVYEVKSTLHSILWAD